VPSCNPEVTFFLALKYDILGVFIFSGEIISAITGKKMMSRASDKKSVIKPTVESSDKWGCMISIAFLSDIRV
jgi:hypothetical protein